LATAIIVDMPDVLTDESENDKNAVAFIRQIVATAGVRVSEQGLTGADAFSIDSYAPHQFHSMIFKLVNRDTTLALRCISAFNKNFTPVTKIRPEAADILNICKQRGWRVAIPNHLSDEQLGALEKAKLLPLIAIRGLPRQMKIDLPDARVLEFLLGSLGIGPGDCLMLGTRIDNNVRPANIMRIQAIQLRLGRHGKHQLPRDLKDVPDYEAPDVAALLNVLPTVV
jgi:putative hydrolase of the HAD superfamily